MKLVNEEASKKLCEIAYIAGRMTQRGLIDLQCDTLDDAHVVYEQILKDWEDEVDVEEGSEEHGYISAYASKRLIQLFAVRQ